MTDQPTDIYPRQPKVRKILPFPGKPYSGVTTTLQEINGKPYVLLAITHRRLEDPVWLRPSQAQELADRLIELVGEIERP